VLWKDGDVDRHGKGVELWQDGCGKICYDEGVGSGSMISDDVE